MGLSVNLNGPWRLIYLQAHRGNLDNRKYRIPMIEAIEIPVVTESQIFAVSAVWIEAKPSWYRAGYLKQEIVGINLNDQLTFGSIGEGPSALDAGSRVIPLNNVQLVIFPRLAAQSQLRFEPVGWLEKVTLGVWEYMGSESD